MAIAARTRVNGSEPKDAVLERVVLRPIERQVAIIAVRGLSGVIPHRWSEKSKTQMRVKQTGPKARAPRAAKLPDQEAYESCYWLAPPKGGRVNGAGGRAGIPATAFKTAIVDAAQFWPGITKTVLKVAVFVEAAGPDYREATPLVEVKGKRSQREDTPRNANFVPDLRYRVQIDDWSAVLRVRYVTSLLDLDSLINLVNAAGMGGVGDWRPSSPRSRSGTFGTFEVDARIPARVERT